MHPKTIQLISSMRAKCNDEADHKFVDAFESICKAFEAPREPIDPLRNLHLGPKAQEAWDKAIQDLIDFENKKKPPHF